MLRDVLALLKRERDDAVLAGQLRERLGSVMPPAQVGAQVQQLLSPWYRYFISYDPAPTLRRVRCPVLAIGGEKDLQVPPKQNLPAIRAALEAGGNTRAQVQELPGLNHLFQTATTGSPTEYARIEETMSPVALDLISSWLLRQ